MSRVLTSLVNGDDKASSTITSPATAKCMVIKLLGEGSYGKVYKVLYKSLLGPSQILAVKTAPVVKASSLTKEHRIYQALGGSCPEIVRCFSCELSAENGSNYLNLFLEYAPLGTLKGLMRTRGRAGLPETAVRFHARTILKGLDFLHSRGYVHCDLKPDNILVFQNHQNRTVDLPHTLKIADFGLAVEPGEELRRELCKLKFRGTPFYMSPESVLLGQIGPELDIWSLGCIIVEMLSGKHAWEHVINGGITLPDFMLNMGCFEPSIPDEASDCGKNFLSKCFERDYNKRWPAFMLLDHPYLSV